MWKQWINAILGLAIIIVSFALGDTLFAWMLGIGGALVLVLSFWAIAEVPREQYSNTANRQRNA